MMGLYPDPDPDPVGSSGSIPVDSRALEVVFRDVAVEEVKVPLDEPQMLSI